ncbi:hypothetical protein EXIGLDRAFT_767200 [Exidia glandulosa HHB12029]|uniref:F-box domain-containing protein n=1 Tax=Exidia glandulosa HHB12029 TaxID=1314781 RepID=A0A165J542_EXIGL|nr:hypothetical protein EXIGLDRAFT_767200 [Exidia glandulosa HHB12029]
MDPATVALRLGHKTVQRLRTERLRSVESANGVVAAVSLLTTRRLDSNRRLFNSRNALVGLPPSVLRRLLEHSDLAERVSISQTCSALRGLSLSMVHLWREIRLRSNNMLRAFYVMRRAAPAPIFVTLSVDARTSGVVDKFEDFAAAVFPMMEYFDLTVLLLKRYWPVDDADDALQHAQSMSAWCQVRQALTLPSPRMRTLLLTIRSRHGHDPFYLDDQLLGGAECALRFCSLRGIRLPSSGLCNALSSLVTFDYKGGRTKLRMHDVADILRISPCLHTLGLHGLESIADDESVAPVTHPALKKAAIHLAGSPQSAARTAARIFSQVDELVFLSGFINDGMEDELEWGGPVRVYFPLGIYAAVQYGVPPRVTVHTNFERWPPVLASSRLVTVVLHEMEVSRYGSPPSAPNVTDLCIMIASPCDTRRTPISNSIFVETDVAFDYPSLKALSFACARLRRGQSCNSDTALPPRHCTCQDGSTIALSDVSDLITRGVRWSPPGRLLDRVVLAGFSSVVDVDMSRPLDSLRTMTSHLEFAPSLPLDAMSGALMRRKWRNDDLTRVFDGPDVPDIDTIWAMHTRPQSNLIHLMSY